MINYYKILGVRRDADASQIKKAYRRLAFLFHPDVNQTAEAHQKFVLINEAYKTLSNEVSKKRHDLSLHYGVAIPETKEEESKYDQDKGRKYGTAHKYKEDENFRNHKKKETFSQREQAQFNRLEIFLFYSLIFIGFVAIIFSIIDLIYNRWGGFDSLKGLIFGVLFTSLNIYTWYNFRGKKK